MKKLLITKTSDANQFLTERLEIESDKISDFSIKNLPF